MSWSSGQTLSRAPRPNLHEIDVSLVPRNGKRNLERHLAHGEPVVVAAGVLLEQRFQFFDFLHEELGNCLALQMRGLQLAAAAAAEARCMPAVVLGRLTLRWRCRGVGSGWWGGGGGGGRGRGWGDVKGQPLVSVLRGRACPFGVEQTQAQLCADDEGH